MKRSTKRVSRRQFAGAGLSTLAALSLPSIERVLAQTPPVQGGTVSAAVEQANVAVVNEFCAALGRRNLDGAVAKLADNCTYRASQQRPPTVGKDAVTAAIKGFINRVDAFVVLKTVTLGPIVVHARNDVFVASANRPAATYHVAAGVFFVENGKIVEWTDYVLL
jgi:limonene-1,2-epoxide hydrolase